MPAARSSRPNAGPSSSRPRHESGPKSKQKHQRDEGTAEPGVQRLKSALRQTRRLLAKDNLAADVRVETERRLKSLEGDLATAEVRRKERAFAVRYHKVKFFDRQKVTRKINQTKRKITAAGETKKSSTDLENELFELRVDLNYILHYPKLEKYISLFPSSDRQDEQSSGTSSETDAKRQEIRDWMRTKMRKGELDMEPEVELEKKDKRRPADKKTVSKQFGGRPGIKDEIAQTIAQAPPREDVVADDFFDVAEDEGSGSDTDGD
ncbi:hypothetical protein BD410DRAFT_754913 [Rickenella mellea]|uniref:rRNA-processing protein EFG1 n=1 Tax=Rickenella mellea TaxID=50990 RepID=A0A4Y7PP70_9AGAM|nr:hypothetical protein BD410DRAFT_754913 [Rickenella mellea]